MLVSPCRRLGWTLATSLVLIAAAAAEDPAAARIARLFAPFRTDTASLSPDGKHLAFSEHENGTLSLKLVALETNKVRRVAVSEDYVEPMSGFREKLPSRLTFLRWKSPTRLIFSVDDNVIWAINADGSEPRLLISARDVRTDWQQKRERNPLLNRAGQGRSPFSRRPNTPDMSADTDNAASLLGSRGNDEDIADAAAGLPSADTADAFAGFSLAWKTDRHPVVADLLDDDPDNILVEARSNTGLLDDAATLNGAGPACERRR